MLLMIIRRLLGAARLTTMRTQQPIPSASKLASGLAADPQHWATRTERDPWRTTTGATTAAERGEIGFRPMSALACFGGSYR